MTENYRHQFTDSSELGLSIPFGKNGDRVVSYNIAGKHTDGRARLAFDGIVIGTMNSGKTNFLNTLITSAAMKYSPSELQIILLDYKTTIEASIYNEAKLPHINQLILTQNPEDGYAVLKRVESNFNARKELLSSNKSNSIEEYNKHASPAEKLPRLLIIIDEADKLFNNSSEACKLMLEFITEARYVGIHFLLSTQKLSNFQGNNEQLIRNFIGYLYIRIAFSCRFDDAKMFFGDCFDSRSFKGIEESGKGYITDNYAILSQKPVFFQCAYENNGQRYERVKKIAAFYHEQGYEYKAIVRIPNYQPNIPKQSILQRNCITLGNDSINGEKVVIRINTAQSSNMLIYALEQTAIEKKDKLLSLYFYNVIHNFSKKTRLYFYDANPENKLQSELLRSINVIRDFSSFLNSLSDEYRRRSDALDDTIDIERNEPIFVAVRDIDYLISRKDRFNRLKQCLLELLQNGFLYNIHFVFTAGTIALKTEYDLLRYIPERFVSNMRSEIIASIFDKDRTYQFSSIGRHEFWFSNIYTSGEVKKMTPFIIVKG